MGIGDASEEVVMNKILKVLGVVGLLTVWLAPAHAETSQKPNFLVIVADDLGWSDLGFLGSSIRTPTLDALAQDGVFMSHFYVAPTCSPTRSMLMTGVSNQAAGLGTMHGMQTPNQIGQREYGAQLHDQVLTVAEMLQAHDYVTSMSGKWHLALDSDQYPNQRGFDHSFGLIQGGASHFADQIQLHVAEDVTYHENGEAIDLPDNFYSTTAYTDKIIEFIDKSGSSPFFAYVAYTAPHDPLQVPDGWLDEYAGVFDAGPADFKERRRQRLVELRIIPVEAEMAETLNFPSWLPSYKRPWAERPASERRADTRRMEIYASMVELMDQEIGRLLAHLEANDKLENTYVMFLSDNGASTTTPLVYLRNTREWIHENFDLSVEQMGRQASFTTMGRDWANVSNTPFRMFKGSVAEGGVRSPLIVSGPTLESNLINPAPSHVIDIVPTIFDLAEIKTDRHPLYEGKLLPRGETLVPLLRDATTGNERIFVTELFGNRMVRQNEWKAVYFGPPLGDETWQLYDIVADPSATTDLAANHPEILNRLETAYDDFAAENKIISPNPPLSMRVDSFYEGECNWWCNIRFQLTNFIIN